MNNLLNPLYRRVVVRLLAVAVLALAGCGSADDSPRPPETDEMDYEVTKTDPQWQQCLTPEQYRIARQKGTERAFTGAYHDFKEPGVYKCVACGQPLYRSEDKFDSGTGWPSFTRAVDEGNIRLLPDRSHGMMRTEVVCGRCGSHLGHVFDDGPQPTGLRYCNNGVALRFIPD